MNSVKARVAVIASLAAIVVASSVINRSIQQTTAAIERSDLVGFWEIDWKNEANLKSQPQYSWPYAFYFHGDSVTLHFVSERPRRGLLPSLARLRVKRVNDDFFYLSPWPDDWHYFASMENGAFYVSADQGVKCYMIRKKKHEAIEEFHGFFSSVPHFRYRRFYVEKTVFSSELHSLLNSR